jgi:hypothetical protein
VIAARWAVLLVAALMILVALGAADPDLQPSALRLMVTAVVALLAPLFWPGIAATPVRTVLRVAGWSVAAACLAALALSVFGRTLLPPSRAFGACAMLTLILILTHALAAMLERQWRDLSVTAQGARELACRTSALLLALSGSLPLWFGPTAELLAARYDWIVDAILGMSPLAHLAIASGNDLLRNQWFYQHSNLASLQVAYPEIACLFWGYSLACSILVPVMLALDRVRRPFNGTTLAHPTKEKTK